MREKWNVELFKLLSGAKPDELSLVSLTIEFNESLLEEGNIYS